MIIVTGGAGFIGSCLIKYLNEMGHHDIFIVDEFNSDEKWKNLTRLSFQDVILKEQLFDSWSKLPQAKVVYHLGAISATTETNQNLLFHNNYQYTKKLAHLSIQAGAKFVYASSAATYGDGSQGYNDEETGLVKLKPLNFYGFSKQLFDLYAQRNDFFQKHKIIGLKYFNVFGPGEEHKGDMRSVVLRSFEQFNAEGRVKLFKSYKPDIADGEQQRDFVYVKDAVKMSYYLQNHPSNIGGIFNIGSGQAKSFKDLVFALEEALNVAIPIEFIDMPVSLRAKYQYFTAANLAKLNATQTTSYRLPESYSLNAAVADYVNQYLRADHFRISN